MQAPKAYMPPRPRRQKFKLGSLRRCKMPMRNYHNTEQYASTEAPPSDSGKYAGSRFAFPAPNLPQGIRRQGGWANPTPYRPIVLCPAPDRATAYNRTAVCQDWEGKKERRRRNTYCATAAVKANESNCMTSTMHQESVFGLYLSMD